MARKNKFTRILSVCAVALIVALSAVPAMAASNSDMTYSKAFFPLNVGWTATDGSTIKTYERDGWNAMPQTATSVMQWYGPNFDATANTVIGQMYLDYYDNGTGYDEAGYTVSFTNNARIVRLTLQYPVFIPESVSQIAPILGLRCVDADIQISCTVKGYSYTRTTNTAYTSVENKWTPFSVSSNTAVASEDYYYVEFPRGDLYVTSIVLQIVSQDAAGNTYDWNDLNIITSALDPTQYNDYIADVAELQDFTFTAQLPSEANADFVSWIGVAVGAFWNFELVPGLTIQGIVYGCLGFGLLIAFLKYFAGG